MSAFSSVDQNIPDGPVRAVGGRAWLITCTPERTETRARHGRARWCLSAGLRRRPRTTRPLRMLA